MADLYDIKKDGKAVVQYPDYNNSIANLACSILKYYGVEPVNNTLKLADEYLKTRRKNVVLLLLDGMGVSSMVKHLDPHGFFRSNLVYEYSSTFPSTTVAATTAIESGLFPNQSAWIGWSAYFKELDRNVSYFRNSDNDTWESIEGVNVAETYVPYKGIRAKISDTGAGAYAVSPFADDPVLTYDELCDRVASLCREDGEKYIYAYWEEPDKSMHMCGEDSETVKEILADVERKTAELAKKLKDTLLIITADHGQVNSENKCIADYPDIMDCLVRMPSVEPRSCSFFVKDGCKERFSELFKENFGDEFLLLTRREVFDLHLLGTGEDHEHLDSMIGDYLAVAVGKTAITNKQSCHIGNHAGMTAEEMTVPLIVIER